MYFYPPPLQIPSVLLWLTLPTGSRHKQSVRYHKTPSTPSPSSPSLVVAHILSALLLCPPSVVEQWMPMMAPLPRSLHEWTQRQSINIILHQLYQNSSIVNELQLGAEWIRNNNNDPTLCNGPKAPLMDSSTYGEITTIGARQLLNAMGLLHAGTEHQKTVHFVDLGSGAGKLITQMVLETEKSIQVRATGVELSTTRHQAAIQSKERLLATLGLASNVSRLLSLNQTMTFIRGDFLQVDWSDATHIYVASLCFPKALMHQLEDKLIRDCPSLQCIATLQRFPNDLRRKGFTQLGPSVQRMEMSWTKPFGGIVYLYYFDTG